MLTFPTPVFISSIKIYPRDSGFSNYLNGMTVLLDDSNIWTVEDIWTVEGTGAIREIFDVDRNGSIVKIIGGSEKIQMAELEIYGSIAGTEIIVYWVKLIKNNHYKDDDWMSLHVQNSKKSGRLRSNGVVSCYSA